MATTAPTQRSGGEQAGPATFSYAQAAKGLSAPPSSTTSKPSSGSATPAKDPQVTTTPAAGVMNWADDAEAETAPLEPTTSSQESRTQPPAPASKEPASEAPAPSAVSSPDLGASSASTVTKDDDMSSIPNTSSDSTWDNKSQASTSVEKSVDSIEKPSEKGEGRKGKGKGKNVEKAPAKPLTDAPVPMVNIWKQRAEEAKARVVPRPASSRPASVSAPALPNGASQGFTTSAKQAKVTSAADASSSKEKAPNGESRVKAREEEKGSQIRKDTKLESDADKAKKFTKGRAPQEKEPRPTQSVLPLMPARDQEAWPTPETAVDEDRKKANEKTDKVEPEHKESSAPKTKWNKLPITPTVVFNTPMPNGTSSRRGGGRGGRGGAQTGGRPGGFESGNPQLEKDSIVGASLPNGDQSKRGRADAPAQDASPKEKRTMSAGPLKEKVPTSGEKGSKTAGSDVDAVSRRSGDSAPNSQAPGQNNAFPRPYPASRPNKARRGDYSGQDRRKDGDSVSPIKENGTFNGRRNSAATQTEVTENGEVRGPSFADGHAPHPKRGHDRQYSSFSRGERGRGGGRGGRGSYQNSHQYSNGHNPAFKPSSTYSGPLSPTAFNPDPNAYFSPPHGKYRGPRSQSVTTDSMFRMSGPYGGPQQVPPIQTFMNGPYDYPIAQPMSAVPFGQYAMDPYSVFSMLTMQLDYYFSLDNLLKDMYLRKHMDTQGFVFLSVIAGFKRVKQLTTDVELIKLVCFQSQNIDFRIGQDGKDRVRCKEGWNKWVLPLADRDASAQNEGPDETYNPPIPHPHGVDQNTTPRFPDMSAPATAGPMPFGNEGGHPNMNMNGFTPGASQHIAVHSKENLSNGTAAEGINGTVIPDGHSVDNATNAVSGEPDSFSDEQIEGLTVIVRKQDQSLLPALLPATIRTFSNGTLDSRSGVPDEPETSGRQASVKANGTGPSSGVDRTTSPFTSTSETTPVRLYWVKDNDTPVNVVPVDSTHESYLLLRSKALQQRQNTSGSCPYDMHVLYQFWSHFLIRNFNSRMYDEFRDFALEDASTNISELGLTNLIKFYGAALLSSQSVIRTRVARDYVQLVRTENEHRRPAFKQLQSVMRNELLEPQNRQQIYDFLDAELWAALE